MTERQAINNSIAHWKRMIWWVIEICILNPFNLFRRPSYINMKLAIGEYWQAKDCALCEKYNSFLNCSRCPLGKKDNCKAMGSMWRKIDLSKTWRVWFIHAVGMLRQLKSL